MKTTRYDLIRGVTASRITFALAVLATVMSLSSGALEVFPLDKQLLAVEPWRLFSGHLVHSDGEHLVWNLLGLAILGLAFEPMLRWQLAGVLLAAAAMINGWFFAFDTQLSRYCGLSGALNGLLVLGLLEWWRRSGEILPLLIGLGASLKIWFEMASGLNVFTDPAWRSVPQAHLIGMLSGLAWFLLARKRPAAGGNRV